MAVQSQQYASPTSQDTTRGPSQSIWRRFDTADFGQKSNMAGFGVEIWDDFVQFPTVSSAAAIGNIGQWAAWAASGQTMVDGVEEGGVAKMDGGTANKSTILTSNAGAFRFAGGSTAYNLTGGMFAMEMRIALGSVAASQQGVFFGVADNTGSQINSSDTTIIASGGNTLTTTKNLFGFFNRTTTSPADWSFVYQPAAGTAVYPTGLTTLVNTVTGANQVAYAASTDKGKGTGFVKIGLLYDPTGSIPQAIAPSTCPSGQTAGNMYKPLISFYVNGQLMSQFINPGIVQGTTFPTNCVMSPVFNYMNIAGATAPIYLDWLRFAQVGSY